MPCCHLASILAPEGWLVLKLEPGQMFCCVSFANDQSGRRMAGAWAASVGEGSGFTPEEVRAVAVDRGGIAL